MHQHEAAAADVAGLRMRHREREADRDRRIDRIAARLQYFHADMGRALVLARHHAVLCDNGEKARRIGEDRRLRGRGGLGVRKVATERDDKGARGKCEDSNVTHNAAPYP